MVPRSLILRQFEQSRTRASLPARERQAILDQMRPVHLRGPKPCVCRRRRRALPWSAARCLVL